MVDINQLDPANLATISAIVAALVTVIGNAFNLPTKYRSLLAIGFGFVLVFLPQFLLNKFLTALVIGLTASGVYSQVKPLKFFQKTTSKDTEIKNNKSNVQTHNSSSKQDDLYSTDEAESKKKSNIKTTTNISARNRLPS